MPREEDEPKPIGRTNSGSVILFDPASQTIRREKRKKLDRKYHIKIQIPTLALRYKAARKTSFKGKAPKLGSSFNIYHEADSSLLVATLKLDKLGWLANWQRLRGNCNEIYAVDWPDDKKSPFHAALAA